MQMSKDEHPQEEMRQRKSVGLGGVQNGIEQALQYLHFYWTIFLVSCLLLDHFYSFSVHHFLVLIAERPARSALSDSETLNWRYLFLFMFLCDGVLSTRR